MRLNVFIAGSSGYLGSILLDKLSSKFNVIAGTRKTIQLKKNFKNVKKINYLDKKSVIKSLKNVDILIHLVGMNEKECRTKKKNSLIFQSKVTNNFLNSCVLNNVKKIIYISTEKVNKKKKNYYIKRHLIAENIIKKNKLINYTIIRAPNIFGFSNNYTSKEIKNTLVYSLIETLIKKKTLVIKKPNQYNDLVPSNIFVEYLNYIISKSKFNSSIVKISYKKNNLKFFARLIERRVKKLLNLETNLNLRKKIKSPYTDNQNKKNNSTKEKFSIKKKYNKNIFIKEIDRKIIYIYKTI